METVTIRPPPQIGNPGPFTYYVVDLGKGKVRLSRYADGRYGPVMPRASVKHFVNDLEGRVQLRPSKRPEIDALIRGTAQLLGKGDDGVAFRVGDKVVKMSTTVPYQPENPGHRSPAEAIERLRKQTLIHNAIVDRLGTSGCLERAEFVRHGDKGFQIKPYVEVVDKFTRDQLDALQDCVIAIHALGYGIGDNIQAGVDARGRPVMFDVGKAAPLPPNDARQSWPRAQDDRERLARLYRDSGQRYVRRDLSEAEQYWTKTKEDVAGLWAGKPERHDFAQSEIGEASEMRREEAHATMEGEALTKRLDQIDRDERWLRGSLDRIAKAMERADGEEDSDEAELRGHRRQLDKRSRKRGDAKVQIVVDVTSLSAGVVGGIVLNRRRPQGINVPVLGTVPTSAGLAVAGLAVALVARAAGWHRTKRAAVGVGAGATLASFAGGLST